MAKKAKTTKKRGRPKMFGPRRLMKVHLPLAMWRSVRELAHVQSRSVQSIIERAIREHLATIAHLDLLQEQTEAQEQIHGLRRSPGAEAMIARRDREVARLRREKANPSS
jgi:hypothetical protein